MFASTHAQCLPDYRIWNQLSKTWRLKRRGNKTKQSASMWSTLVVQTAKCHSMNTLGRVQTEVLNELLRWHKKKRNIKAARPSVCCKNTGIPLRGVYSFCLVCGQSRHGHGVFRGARQATKLLVNRRDVLAQFTRRPSIWWQWGLDIAAIGTFNVFTLPNMPKYKQVFSKIKNMMAFMHLKLGYNSCHLSKVNRVCSLNSDIYSFLQVKPIWNIGLLNPYILFKDAIWSVLQ